MIALDTSALLRYLTHDDAGLAAEVDRVMEGVDEVIVSVPVIMETTHALRGAPYHLNNPGIADTLLALLAHGNVRLAGMDAGLASAAIASVRHLSARHIADALVSAAAHEAGARQLLTNDRSFASQLVPVVQLGAQLGG